VNGRKSAFSDGGSVAQPAASRVPFGGALLVKAFVRCARNVLFLTHGYMRKLLTPG